MKRLLLIVLVVGTAIGNLQSIHCEPLTPPEIEPYTFNEIPTDIEVYDMAGREVLHERQGRCVDLTDQPRGGYLIRVSTRERTIEKELIKQ